MFRCILVCLLTLAIPECIVAEAAVRHPRPASRPVPQQIEVLFLSSLDPDLPDVAAMIEQTETEILSGSDKPVRFSSEYLDFASALSDRARGKATASYLLDKYHGQTFQLVVAIGEETVMFAEPMQAKLFPAGTLLFFVVDPQNTSLWINQTPRATGVIRETNYLPTLELALRQNPGTSRVMVVSGSSDGEKLDLRIARKQFQGYERNLKFEYVTDLELAELGPRLAAAQPGTVILLLDFAADPSGEKFIPARILPAISKAAARPIYGAFSSVVGNGALGGYVADLSDAGRTLGHDGARILKGEKAEDILVTTSNFQHYVIDWHQLHRWGIPGNQLPAASVLLNWEYSPWELYRWRILGLSAILLIETLLIALLLLNIAKRKRAQAALAKGEKELADAQRFARVGNWLWNVNKQELKCSEELYRICGLDPAVPLPQVEALPQFFTPESWRRLTVATEKAWQTDSVQEVDAEVIRPDGSIRWVRIRGEAVHNTSGRVNYLHGTIQDITERKQADEIRSRLASIVESSDDAIISKNLDGVITSWNRGAERVFGFAEAEALGQPITLIIPPELREEEAAILNDTRAGKKVEHYETVRVTKTGKRIDISMTISPLRDANGQIVGSSKIARDITDRKRAQEDLQKSQERFSKVFRQSPTALALTDAETHRYLDVNEAFERLSGYTRAELIGNSALEVGLRMIPEERGRLTQQLHAERFLRNVECEFRTKDGRRVIGLTSAELIEIGGQVCILGVIADITDRKEIEAELRISQDRVAGIVASAMDAIIAVDHEQRVLLFNTAAEQMFGCAAAEVIGHSIGRFIPERFHTAHGGHVRHFGLAGVTNRITGSSDPLWAVRANGEEFPIEATVSQVENAGKPLFTVIIRDATERRRAELAAAESEKRFRLIANTAPVLIWMSDPDKLCSYFNESWLDFTGRSLEQELGNGWAQSVHSQDLQGCLHTYTQFFDRREKFNMEYRLRRHDGEYRWVLDIGVPRFNSDGSFAGYVGCCMDISDLKRAKATVTEFSGRLLRAGEEERGRVARELHDDINQRLALLANGVQEVEQAVSADKNPSRKQRLHALWQLTNEIATDIQHISHQLHPSKLHYLGLATTVRQLCNEFAQQHKIDIECIVKELPGNLDENVSLNLFRVVQESLRNVAKHSHARHVKVEFTCQSDVVHLSISDDGVGFDPESPRVNHGLGLVSMRERLRSVGGEFSIWSKPSLGTLVEGKVRAVTKPASSELTVVDATGTE